MTLQITCCSTRVSGIPAEDELGFISLGVGLLVTLALMRGLSRSRKLRAGRWEFVDDCRIQDCFSFIHFFRVFLPLRLISFPSLHFFVHPRFAWIIHCIPEPFFECICFRRHSVHINSSLLVRLRPQDRLADVHLLHSSSTLSF